MSGDLREQIAFLVYAVLSLDDLEVAFEVADAVLAVVQPVIEQAERFGESTQDWLRARVATLEAALDRIAHHPRTQSFVVQVVDGETHHEIRDMVAVEMRQMARDALGEQEATPTEPSAWRARDALDDRTGGGEHR